MIAKICLALLASSLVARPEIHDAQMHVAYDVQFPNAVHHEAEVQVTFTGIRAHVLHVLMSRSSPGRYALHEFAKNVYNVRAADPAGQPLRVTRPDPYGWDVAVSGHTVVFSYTLFGDQADGTYAAIDLTHAHLNLPAALVWAQDWENVPSTLRFTAPQGVNWTTATQLKPEPDGSWSAPNLEWMMDSPVEMSVHALETWTIGDATFRLALHHRGTDAEARNYAEMCKAVVLEEEGVFGRFPKYDHGTYTFLIDYLPYASGDGMEHRDSTVITGTADLSSSAHRAIGTVAHEFFHSWNVKRIRPRSLEPFDFERANMSGELWFAEGFTNYYGPLVLRRAGLTSLGEFANTVGHAVNAVLNDPGRAVFNVVGMSQEAPFTDAARSIDPTNFRNIFISYYTYGEALALGIDLAIREQFPGKGLDDWMREMWREHPDIDKPYTLDDLEHALAVATGNPGFAADLFRRHIYGKQPMDYAKLFAPAGLLLQKAHPGKPWIGSVRFQPSTEGPEVSGTVLRGSPLYAAGIDDGDIILEWNAQPLRTVDDLTFRVDEAKPGDHVRLAVRTRTGRKQLELVVAEDPTVQVVPFEDASQPVTAEITAFRAAWLNSRALHNRADIKVTGNQ